MFKKLTSFCILLCAALFYGPAAFANDPGIQSAEAELLQYGALSQPQAVQYLSADNPYDAILEGLTNMEAEINLYTYGIPAVQVDGRYTSEELKSLFSTVVNANPQLFYVSPAYNFTCTYSGVVYSLKPQYTMTAAEAAEKTAFFNRTVEGIAGCTAEGMTDFEKVLAVHDYFVLHYEYDTTYSNYSALSIFEDETGVCQAYALGFMAVMQRLGIPCSMVTSDPMRHAWNMVKLGDYYYHVDVTWDDPLEDRVGRVLHKFLLLDDETIASGDEQSRHYGWVAAAEAQDGSYAGSFLTDVTSPFVFADGKWYYIDPNGTVRSRVMATGEEEALYTIDAVWKDLDNPHSIWPGCFSGLGWFNGKLLYNTPWEVCALDPVTKRTETFYTPDTSDGFLYGLYTDGDTLVYGLARNPNDGTDKHRYVLKNPQGDVDGDGIVTANDTVWILSFLVGRNALTGEQQSYADITGDGLVTVADAVRVLETAAKLD